MLHRYYGSYSLERIGLHIGHAVDKMDTEMGTILNKLGLGSTISTFEHEKITPDVVCKLSMHEMRFLGVHNTSDMMQLRVECINYGHVSCRSTVFSNDRHEPKYNISRDTLQTLIESGFKITEISKLLSVSERTIYRRMNQFNITVYDFTDIDDYSLEAEVRQVTSEFPRVGETMIRQILRERGIKVSDTTCTTSVFIKL